MYGMYLLSRAVTEEAAGRRAELRRAIDRVAHASRPLQPSSSPPNGCWVVLRRSTRGCEEAARQTAGAGASQAPWIRACADPAATEPPANPPVWCWNPAAPHSVLYASI